MPRKNKTRGRTQKPKQISKGNQKHNHQQQAKKAHISTPIMYIETDWAALETTAKDVWQQFHELMHGDEDQPYWSGDGTNTKDCGTQGQKQHKQEAMAKQTEAEAEEIATRQLRAMAEAKRLRRRVAEAAAEAARQMNSQARSVSESSRGSGRSQSKEIDLGSRARSSTCGK